MPRIKSGSRKAISLPQMRRDVTPERLLDMNAKSQIRDVEKTCVICESNFFCPRHRQTIAKYCGRKCYYIALRGRGSVELNCDVCGKLYRRPPSHAHYVKKTCSLKCRGIASRSELPISKDYPSVRQWLSRRGKLSHCQKCMYSEHPEILVVHHADRDRTNNDLGNLEILCPNCHALEHYAENKKGWAHASTSRKSEKRRIDQYQGNDSFGPRKIASSGSGS